MLTSQLLLRANKFAMNRLIGAPRLMIVSDLDYTMVDHDDPENLSLLRFNSLWEAYYRHDSVLIFSTGRSPIMYKQLRKEKPMLTPDITVLSVGTEITYGPSMVPDDEWEQFLNRNWNRDIVVQETSKFPQLTLQSLTEQRPHKVSFFVEKDKASEVIRSLSARLKKPGLDVKIIYSGGIALDVLPQGAGKGQALAYLAKKFEVDGKKPSNTLVCGDSGNDAELFTVPHVYGSMVSNAQEELLQWYEENARNNPKIIHATERCAAGIIQSLGSFCLGPNISPRDLLNFSECKSENLNLAYEVVKFYILYERWRRAEVEKSEQFIQSLKSVCHPLGIFVHPSGTEHFLHQSLDDIGRFYGDKQGKVFQIWVDRLSLEEIGSNIWLVKFHKWELSGEDQHCCVSTVLLLSSKTDGADGLMWMHLHQTWLDGHGANDQTQWLL